MPGTAYVLFHHVMGETNGKRGVWALRPRRHGRPDAGPRGGRRATSASRSACDAEVARILVRDGTAVGVALANGDEFHAPGRGQQRRRQRDVPASCSTRACCRRTFVAAVERIGYASASLKINVALSRAAELHAPARAPSPARSTAARSTSAPTRTTSSAPTTTPSTAGRRQSPILECTMPSAVDPTVAPPGKHLMSMFIQYAPYKLREGTWDDQRDAVRRPLLRPAQRVRAELQALGDRPPGADAARTWSASST